MACIITKDAREAPRAFGDLAGPRAKTQLVEQPHHARIASYMDAGNELRDESGRTDILALSAVRAIQSVRGGDAPKPCTAYIVRSLKHPDEVRTLREVYGRGFFLLGVSAEKVRRKEVLTKRKGVPSEDADDLLKRDEAETDGHGQQTRSAFELSDAFVALGANEEENLKQIWRILDLLFGQPFITPTRDEYAMFLAYSASLRSADLSRQVGAVVVSSEGELIATGANDVPSAGGGSYWSDGYVDWPEEEPQNDQRDWIRGFDSNASKRDEIAKEVVDRVCLAERGRLSKAIEQMRKEMNESDSEIWDKLSELVETPQDGINALSVLRGTRLMDLSEFGRAVHAEMDALSACNRIGASPRKGTLYCTTFPCHNCTKHIVVSGISRVVFIEPYPKSQAEELHGDAITVSGPSLKHEEKIAHREEEDQRVRFEPFNGIGPRRFLDLFSLTLSSGRTIRRKDAVPKNWSRKIAKLRVSMVPTSYIERETNAIDELVKFDQ